MLNETLFPKLSDANRSADVINTVSNHSLPHCSVCMHTHVQNHNGALASCSHISQHWTNLRPVFNCHDCFDTLLKESILNNTFQNPLQTEDQKKDIIWEECIHICRYIYIYIWSLAKKLLYIYFIFPPKSRYFVEQLSQHSFSNLSYPHETCASVHFCMIKPSK